MDRPSGRRWRRRVAAAVLVVAVAGGVRRLLGPKPVLASDWCPDLVFRRLAQRQRAEEV